MFNHSAGPDVADHALLRLTPTPFLIRRWQRLATQERQMLAATDRNGQHPTFTDDEYDRVADLACIAWQELDKRGVKVCLYCDEVDPQPHNSDGCPDALAARLGFTGVAR